MKFDCPKCGTVGAGVLLFKAGIYWAYSPYTDDVLTTRLKYPDVYVIVIWEKDKK